MALEAAGWTSTPGSGRRRCDTESVEVNHPQHRTIVVTGRLHFGWFVGYSVSILLVFRGRLLTVLARILMLVACGPLLQPAGYCVCKADGFGGSSPVRGSVEVQPPDHAAGKKAGCTCSDCTSPGKSRITTTPTAPTPPAGPTPVKDHLPGCPASPGADSLKWVDPTPQVVTVLALPALVCLPAFNPALTAAAPTFPVVRWWSSPPLYLSHCSLVI